MRVESGADVNADLHILSGETLDMAPDVALVIPPPSMPPCLAREVIGGGGEVKALATSGPGTAEEAVGGGDSCEQEIASGSVDSSSERLREDSSGAAEDDAGDLHHTSDGRSVIERGRCQRRVWVNKKKPSSPVASSWNWHTDVSVSPTPTPKHILKKTQGCTNTPQREISRQVRGSSADVKDEELMLALGSPTGLTAAVTAMEQTKRAVQAARRAQVEEDARAESKVVEGYDAIKTGGLSEGTLAGADAWTIRTKNITTASYTPGKPCVAHAGNPSTFPASSVALQSPGAQRTRRPVPGSATTSRCYTATETAVMLEEGKKALLAARKEREREARLGTRGAMGVNKMQPASWNTTPTGELPPSPMTTGSPPLPFIALPSPVDMAPAPPGSSPGSTRSPVSSVDRFSSSSVTPSHHLPPRTPQHQRAPRTPQHQSSPLTPQHQRGASKVATHVPSSVPHGRPGPRDGMCVEESSFVTPSRNRHRHHQERGAVTPKGTPSRLPERCAAYLAHLVKSSSSDGMKPPSPDSSRIHTRSNRPGSISPSKTPEKTGHSLHPETPKAHGEAGGESSLLPHGPSDRSKSATASRSGKKSQHVRIQRTDPPSANRTREIEASPPGVGLVRQQRFRRSVSMEESGPRRLGARVRAAAGSALLVGCVPTGGGAAETDCPMTIRESQATRRKARGWRKVSSGVEIGSLWQR